MALTQIDIGSAPNDGTGDTLREAGIIINANFEIIGDILGTSVTLADFTKEVGGLLFPVDSVYSTYGNINPATLLGFGTWTAYSNDGTVYLWYRTT